MADVTYNSLHFYQLQNYKLDGYAWLTVVEMDGSSVKDQRKIIFSSSLPIHMVSCFGVFVLFCFKILLSFPFLFLLSQSNCKPRNLWSVTSGPRCVSVSHEMMPLIAISQTPWMMELSLEVCYQGKGGQTMDKAGSCLSIWYSTF